MKSITWKIGVSDTNELAIVEDIMNLPPEKIESQLIIIGVLENLKQLHLDKMKALYSESQRQGGNDGLDL